MRKAKVKSKSREQKVKANGCMIYAVVNQEARNQNSREDELRIFCKLSQAERTPQTKRTHIKQTKTFRGRGSKKDRKKEGKKDRKQEGKKQEKKEGKKEGKIEGKKERKKERW